MKLQDNFTTKHQSKRLLKLGVPADSADMYFLNSLKFPYFLTRSFCEEMANTPDDVSKIPCWSIGRLMEIFEICTGLVWQNEVIDGYTKVDMLLEDFEDVEKKYTFDFSKLEE